MVNITFLFYQGTVLDRIDYHCTVALEKTKEGVKSLVEVC